MFKIFKKKKQEKVKIKPLSQKGETEMREFIDKLSANYVLEETEIDALLARDANIYMLRKVYALIHAYTVDNRLYNENMLLRSCSATNDEAVEIKNKLCKNTIVKLKIRRAKHNVIRKECLLVNVLDTNSQNDQLRTILFDLQKGKTIEDDKLGTLLFNTDTNNFEGKINWCGDNCSLNVAYRDEEFLKTNLETVYYLIENQQKIKEDLIKRIYEFNFVEYIYGKIDKKSLIEDIQVTNIISFKQGADYYYNLEMEARNILPGLIIEVDGSLEKLYEIEIIDPETGTNFE